MTRPSCGGGDLDLRVELRPLPIGPVEDSERLRPGADADQELARSEPEPVLEDPARDRPLGIGERLLEEGLRRLVAEREDPVALAAQVRVRAAGVVRQAVLEGHIEAPPEKPLALRIAGVEPAQPEV